MFTWNDDHNKGIYHVQYSLHHDPDIWQGHPTRAVPTYLDLSSAILFFLFYFFIDVLQIPLTTMCTKYYCDKKIVSYLNNKCQLSPSLLTIGWASSRTKLVVRSQRTLSTHRLRTISFTFSSPFLQPGIKPPPLIKSRNLPRGDSRTACCSRKLLYRSKKWRRKRLDFAGFKILPARICMAELPTSYTETCPRGERTRRIPESLKSCVWLLEKPGGMLVPDYSGMKGVF